jgi:hypothetical protein
MVARCTVEKEHSFVFGDLFDSATPIRLEAQPGWGASVQQVCQRVFVAGQNHVRDRWHLLITSTFRTCGMENRFFWFVVLVPV